MEFDAEIPQLCGEDLWFESFAQVEKILRCKTIGKSVHKNGKRACEYRNACV